MSNEAPIKPDDIAKFLVDYSISKPEEAAAEAGRLSQDPERLVLIIGPMFPNAVTVQEAIQLERSGTPISLQATDDGVD